MYPKIFYGPPHVRVKYSIALTKVQHTLWTSSSSIHWSDVQSAKRHSQFTDAPKQVGACAKKAGGKFKQPKSKMTAQEYIRPLDHQHSSITTQTPCPHGGGPQHSSNSRWRRWPFWGFTSRPGAPHPLLEPTLWKMEMEHILLTSTWQHMNQVRNFGRPQDIFVMHAYTWFALVSDFTSEFSHSSM